MTDEEANSVAAFLRAESEGKETKLKYDFPEGDVTRGAAVAESLHCGTCHPGMPGGVSKFTTLEGVFEADWSARGCLAEADDRPELPILNLGEGDREGLLAFSKTGTASLKRDSASEFASRQIQAKSCTACHTLMGSYLAAEFRSRTPLKNTPPMFTILNERVDQSRPQLTFRR